MTYILDHTNFHFGIIELIGLLFMLAIILIVWKKLKKLKEDQEELEDKLGALNGADVVELNDSTKEKVPTELDGAEKE